MMMGWTESCETYRLLQCYHLVEKHEDDIEEWYFHNQKEDIMSYLCRKRVLTDGDQSESSWSFRMAYIYIPLVLHYYLFLAYYGLMTPYSRIFHIINSDVRTRMKPVTIHRLPLRPSRHVHLQRKQIQELTMIEKKPLICCLFGTLTTSPSRILHLLCLYTM